MEEFTLFDRDLRVRAVILGGLVTSTALNLLVLPTLALKYGRFEAAQQADI